MSTQIYTRTVVKDESSLIPSNNVINFTGAGVSVSNVGGEATVDIPGNVPATTYGLYSQIANSATLINGSQGSLIGTGVGTLSVPPNGFSVGDSFKADFGGVMSCKNNETITIRIKAGTTELSISPTFQMPGTTNQVWLLTINFTIRAIGPAGTASIVVLAELHVLKQASGTQQGFGWNTIKTTDFNTTIPNTLDVTAQWGSNTPAQNSIYSDIFVLNKTY
jgi:hypothetical protein